METSSLARPTAPRRDDDPRCAGDADALREGALPSLTHVFVRGSYVQQVPWLVAACEARKIEFA